MLTSPQRHLALLACFLAAPAVGLPASLVVNTVCESGTCPPVDTLAPGGSTSENFNFTYTFANNDAYQVSGDYSATNPVSGGTTIHIDATAVFLGNPTGGLSGADALSIDLLQDYNVPYSLDGNYTEHSDAFIGGPIALTSSFSAELSYNGNGLGVLGPFTGPGIYSDSSNADLFGMTNPLAASFDFSFDFGAGSAPGATISTVVPEPGSALPLGLVIVSILLPAVRRSARLMGINRV